MASRHGLKVLEVAWEAACRFAFLTTLLLYPAISQSQTIPDQTLQAQLQFKGTLLVWYVSRPEYGQLLSMLIREGLNKFPAQGGRSPALPDYFIVVAAEDAITGGIPRRDRFPFLSAVQFEQFSQIAFQKSGCDLVKPFSSDLRAAVIVVVHRISDDEDFERKMSGCVVAALTTTFGLK